MTKWQRYPAIVALLMAVLQGCGGSRTISNANNQFLGTGRLDVYFIYADTLSVSDQNIIVRIDSGDTTVIHDGAFARELSVGNHTLRCWDEDGSMSRFVVPVVAGRNQVYLRVNHRIRASLPSFNSGLRKIEIPKNTTIIFAVPTQ